MSREAELLKELNFQYRLSQEGYFPKSVIAYLGDIWIGIRIAGSIYAIRSLTRRFESKKVAIGFYANLSKKFYKILRKTSEAGVNEYLIAGKFGKTILQGGNLLDIPREMYVPKNFFDRIFSNKKTNNISFPDLNEFVAKFNNSKSGSIIGFCKFGYLSNINRTEMKRVRLMEEYNNLRNAVKFQLLCKPSEYLEYSKDIQIFPIAYIQNDLGEYEEIPVFIKLK